MGHCISSMLSCSQNTHYAQGPKSNYTHAYIHSLSNLSSFQSPLWSSSVFSLLSFLSFIPIQSPLAKRWHIIGTFSKLWLSFQSTLQKTQCTLHRLKLTFFLIFLWLLGSWCHLLGRLSSVGARWFTATPLLYCFVSLLATIVTLPTELPLWHTQLHWHIPRPILLYWY